MRVASTFFTRTANSEDGQKTGDGTSVGLFIPLPPNLASQFPQERGRDKSPPHVTFLYLGAVPTDLEDRVAEICEGALSGTGVVQGTLNGLEYFINQHGEKIPHVEIAFDIDMSAVRRKLRRELMDAGVEVKDSFHHQYLPHSTLGYYEDTSQEYTGPVPEGSWSVEYIEVWGASKVIRIPLKREEPMVSASISRLAATLRRSDLTPALGHPLRAGPCYIVDRIKQNVNSPKMQQHLIDELTSGGFDSPDERATYDAIRERGPTPKTDMILVEHAQARMDLRGVTVPELRLTLANFLKHYYDHKSKQDYVAEKLTKSLEHGEVIDWVDKALGLETVFRLNRNTFTIITSYWMGASDPRVPPGGCTSEKPQ